MYRNFLGLGLILQGYIKSALLYELTCSYLMVKGFGKSEHVLY